MGASKSKPRSQSVYVTTLAAFQGGRRWCTVELVESRPKAEERGVQLRRDGALVAYATRSAQLGRIQSEWLRGKRPKEAS